MPKISLVYACKKSRTPNSNFERNLKTNNVSLLILKAYNSSNLGVDEF